MLTQLTIKNLALIATLEIPLHKGFLALTGETGAGKSLLLDALGLVLGARTDASLIRHGEIQAEITAIFTPSLNPALQTLLNEQGLELENNELTIRRQIKREGGGKVWANGVAVPLNWLGQVGECLAEIQAQHSAPALLQPARQRELLGSVGGLKAQTAAVAQAHEHWWEAEATAQAAAHALAHAEASQAVVEANLKLLETTAYEAGEEEQLLTQRNRLQHAAAIGQNLTAADDALNAEQGAVQALRVASKQIQLAAKLAGDLAPLATQLQEVLVLAEEAAHTVARANNSSEGEGSLEALDDRLHALKGLARRLGCSVPELTSKQTELQAALADSSALATAASNAEAAEKLARSGFEQACQTLSAARKAAGNQLTPQLQAALRQLLLPHAEVAVQLTALPTPEWNSHGAETVQFMLAANPGQPLQPIQKVASGGELARLLLALKQVFYAGLPPQVIILDEVDTGLSGAAASAVGAAMAALGQRHQVLAVTHHAQVAARASQHGKLSKQVKNGTTTTQLEWLHGATQTEELARLLAGESITPAARAAAEALLSEAKVKCAA